MTQLSTPPSPGLSTPRAVEAPGSLGRVAPECGCGCDEQMDPFTSEGKPRRFINGHNSRLPRGGKVTWICTNCGTEKTPFRSEVHERCGNCVSFRSKGPLHPRWEGGRTKKNGYVYVWKPGHAEATKKGYVLEHRLVAEEMLGRPLSGQEHVHHLNRDRGDNRPENLSILQVSEHASLHGKEGNAKRWGSRHD